MTDALRLLPAERLDLVDVQKLIKSAFDDNRFRDLKMFLGTEPGGNVFDGFRVIVPDQAIKQGRVQVVNGIALDRLCNLVYKASETTITPDLLFEELNIAKEVSLPMGSWKIEVEYTWTPGLDDGRAFFDPTFDNGLNCCNDEKPDGKEVAFNFLTRNFPDWKVIILNGAADWSYQGDFFSGGFPTVRIPIARVTVDVTGVTDTVETPTTTVLKTLDSASPYQNLLLNSTRYLYAGNSVELYYQIPGTGTIAPIYNGGVNIWPISDVDYINNSVFINTLNMLVVPSILKVIAGAGAVNLLQERLGSDETSDFRDVFYSRIMSLQDLDEVRRLLVNTTADDKHDGNFDNSSTPLFGPLLKNIDEPIIRNPNRLKDFMSFLKALQLVITEMKYGNVTAFTKVKNSTGTDTGYNRENWTGLAAEVSAGKVDDASPGILGSLNEVAQARVRYPQYRDLARQFIDTTLQERLAADKVYNITVGDGVNSYGDFNGAQGFVNAIWYVNDNLSNFIGTIHVKEGNYDLNGTTIPVVWMLPKGWSLVGDGSGKTFVRLKSGRKFIVRCGQLAVADYKMFGQRVQGITFSEQVEQDISMVEVWVDTENARTDLTNYLIENLIEFHDVGFVSELGATLAVTDTPAMVWVSLEPGKTNIQNFSHGILFDNCKWFCGGTNGKVWLDLDYIQDNYSNLRNVKVRNCNFRGNDSILYGIRIAPSTTWSIPNDCFSIENCVFSGMKQITNSNWSCILFNVTSSSQAYRGSLFISGCKFYSSLSNVSYYMTGSNVVSQNGFGITIKSSFVPNLGRTPVIAKIRNCEFVDLQVGATIQHGSVEIDGCSFFNCAIGALVGDTEFLTNKVRLDIRSSTFKGALIDFDIVDGATSVQAMKTIGICCQRVFPSGLFGFSFPKTAYIVGSHLNIENCSFLGIGIGIDFSTLATLASVSHASGEAEYQYVSVTGSRFRCIAGPAVNGLNYNPTDIADKVVCVVDRFTFNNNEVQNVMLVAHDAMMSGATFPADQIAAVCQYAVNLLGFRNVVMGNNFDQIGENGWPTAVTAPGQYYLSDIDPAICKFLAVLGNEPKQGCFSVIIKNNTITNYNNIKQGCYEPYGYPNGELSLKKQGCWAGLVLFCDGGTSTDDKFDYGYKANGIVCDISDNMIGGEYSGVSPNGAGRYCNNGFYVGARDISFSVPPPASALKSIGTLSFKGNRITTNRAQYHLYLDWVGSGSNEFYKLGWKQIYIQSNECRNWNSQFIYYPPPLSTLDKVHLVHVEGYLSGDTDSVYKFGESENILYRNPQFWVLIRDNTFECCNESVALEETRKVSWVDEANKAGVVISHQHGQPNSTHVTDSANVYCKGNQFVGCQYAFLPEGLTRKHLHICEDNMFIGGTKNGVSAAGFFRGIAYLNVTGHVNYGSDPGTGLADDEGSLTKFCGNTVINGTCMVRMLGGVHWGGYEAAYESNCSYHIELSNNVFKGKGAGGGLDDHVGPGSYTNLLKAQFDFIGGVNEGLSGNLSPFCQWTSGGARFSGDWFNIDDTIFQTYPTPPAGGPGVARPTTYGTKSIKVINNHFSAEVATVVGAPPPPWDINFLSFPYDADPIPGVLLADVGDLSVLTDLSVNGCSFMVAANMAPRAGVQSIENTGSTLKWHFLAKGGKI